MERKLDSDGEITIVSPTVEIQLDEDTLKLRWDNTILMSYADDVFNHIQHTQDNGEIVGIDASIDVWDMLFEMQYPYHFEPVPSNSDFDFRYRTWQHEINIPDGME